MTTFKFFLMKHFANFNESRHKASLSERDLGLFKWIYKRPFQTGDKNSIVKKWTHYTCNNSWKSSSPEPLVTFQSNLPSLIKKMQVGSDALTWVVAKWWKFVDFLKIIFSRTIVPISTKLNTKHRSSNDCKRRIRHFFQGEIEAKYWK